MKRISQTVGNLSVNAPVMEENSSTIVNYKKYIDDNILAKPAWLNEVTSTCISLFFLNDRINTFIKHYLQCYVA